MLRKILGYFLVCLIAACAVHRNIVPANRMAKSTSGITLASVQNLMACQNATYETAALFYNLKASAKYHVMFGHMEDNIYGHDGWQNTPGRSDVFELTGAYPAVYGFDFGGIGNFKTDTTTTADSKAIRDRIIEAYRRKGIITFSWHCSNPVSKGSFYWEKSPVNAVSEILPGGDFNSVFRLSLQKIASFAATLQYQHRLIPIIFRPFHEFDGDWFWWGRTHCSIDDYKKLYRYTVTYLRDNMHVTNFLYAWSPDCNFNTLAKYTERYPGDSYVDIAGMDDYADMAKGKSPATAAAKLKIISDFALSHHKVAALTETGLENLPQYNWYTGMLLKALKTGQTQIAYAMVWSNRPGSYYTPYQGHPAAADFIAFKNDPFIWFGNKLGDVYRLP